LLWNLDFSSRVQCIHVLSTLCTTNDVTSSVSCC
jgi:hypothetical protein